MSLFIIRDFRESDRAHVMSSWLRSYADQPHIKRAFGRRPSRVYWDGQHRLAEKLVATQHTRVAAWSEDLDVICGWCCSHAGTVCHYVYVQPEHRGKGVARALLLDAGASVNRFTHYTLKAPAGWVYDPYAAWCPEEDA